MPVSVSLTASEIVAALEFGGSLKSMLCGFNIGGECLQPQFKYSLLYTWVKSFCRFNIDDPNQNCQSAKLKIECYTVSIWQIGSFCEDYQRETIQPM